jgi:putative membrane protein
VSAFTDSDIQRIETAIGALEAKTSAEFVVAVVPSSARYSRGRAAVAVVWAVATSILFFRFVPWGGELAALALQLPVAWAVWALFGWAPLHRRLIPAAEAERAVRANAFRLFAERGVHRTRDATGVLILVSELEHKAVILGDRGVHGVVGDAGWKEHVAHLVQRIRDGKGADGVLEILERLAKVLEHGAPRKPDDTDELPNQVVRKG